MDLVSVTEAPPRRRSSRPSRRSASSSTFLQGKAITPGMALGPAGRVEELPLPDITERYSAIGPEAENVRLDEAIARAFHQIEKMRDRLVGLPEEGRAEIA